MDIIAKQNKFSLADQDTMSILQRKLAAAIATLKTTSSRTAIGRTVTIRIMGLKQEIIALEKKAHKEMEKYLRQQVSPPHRKPSSPLCAAGVSVKCKGKGQKEGIKMKRKPD